MILNPEPNVRPLSIRPPENTCPSNTARSRSSRGESSNPAHLPIDSTTLEASPNPSADNPPVNPEARPQKKQRVHVAASESTPTTITASALTPIGGHPTEVPTTDESDSDHRSRPVNPKARPPPAAVTNPVASASGRPRPSPSPERPLVPGSQPVTLLCHHLQPSIIAFAHGPAVKTTR